MIEMTEFVVEIWDEDMRNPQWRAVVLETNGFNWKSHTTRSLEIAKAKKIEMEENGWKARIRVVSG
jgi:hypothetical protein